MPAAPQPSSRPDDSSTDRRKFTFRTNGDQSTAFDRAVAELGVRTGRPVSKNEALEELVTLLAADRTVAGRLANQIIAKDAGRPSPALDPGGDSLTER